MQLFANYGMSSIGMKIAICCKSKAIILSSALFIETKTYNCCKNNLFVDWGQEREHHRYVRTSPKSQNRGLYMEADWDWINIDRNEKLFLCNKPFLKSFVKPIYETICRNNLRRRILKPIFKALHFRVFMTDKLLAMFPPSCLP